MKPKLQGLCMPNKPMITENSIAEQPEIAFQLRVSKEESVRIIEALQQVARFQTQWADGIKRRPATSDDPARAKLWKAECEWREKIATAYALAERLRVETRR